jgi:hypothetical protein
MPRNVFEGHDGPVNIDMDPEEALKVLLSTSVDDASNEPPVGDATSLLS